MQDSQHKQIRLWSMVATTLLFLRHLLHSQFPGTLSDMRPTDDGLLRLLAVISNYLAEAVLCTVLLSMPFYLLQAFRRRTTSEEQTQLGVDLAFLFTMYISAYFLLFPLF